MIGFLIVLILLIAIVFSGKRQLPVPIADVAEPAEETLPAAVPKAQKSRKVHFADKTVVRQYNVFDGGIVGQYIAATNE